MRTVTVTATSASIVVPQIDAAGNLYVDNITNNAIYVYPRGASGSPAPTRTISGASTGLNTPWGWQFTRPSIQEVGKLGGCAAADDNDRSAAPPRSRRS